MLHRGQRRLCTDTAVAIEHLIRHAVLFQHGDVAGGAVELGLCAEQLKGTAAALVIANRGFRTQRAQAIAAIFSERDHAALVDRIPR